MKIYISGKIGERELSYATRKKFADAEKVFRDEGFEVFNPAGPEWQATLKGKLQQRTANRFDGPQAEYAYIMALDIEQLSACDAICLLPDWKESPGARAELAAAQAYGLSVCVMGKDGRPADWPEP